MHSPFIDTHHKPVIASDLRIVGNPRFWTLLTKASNYREPRSTNMASKTKYNVNNFEQ